MICLLRENIKFMIGKLKKTVLPKKNKKPTLKEIIVKIIKKIMLHLPKALFIFFSGLIIRAIINNRFDIDVFTDYLTIPSIFCYSIISFLYAWSGSLTNLEFIDLYLKFFKNIKYLINKIDKELIIKLAVSIKEWILKWIILAMNYIQLTFRSWFVVYAMDSDEPNTLLAPDSIEPSTYGSWITKGWGILRGSNMYVTKDNGKKIAQFFIPLPGANQLVYAMEDAERRNLSVLDHFCENDIETIKELIGEKDYYGNVVSMPENNAINRALLRKRAVEAQEFLKEIQIIKSPRRKN